MKWETYTKKIQIESRVLGDLAMNHIVPVANRYQSILLDNIVKEKAAFGDEQYERLAAHEILIVKRIIRHVDEIVAKVDEMVACRHTANRLESARDKAVAYHDTVIPLMHEIRANADALEMIVDDEMWTLPKYRELLFVR